MMHLSPCQIAAFYSEDLVDYFYQYLTELKRNRRNWFRHFLCFDDVVAISGTCFEHLRNCARIVVRLTTMAMGDHNSVEFGQAGHFIVAAKCGAISEGEMIRYSGRLPLSTLKVGVIQDDFGIVEIENGQYCGDKDCYIPVDGVEHLQAPQTYFCIV